LVTVWADGLDHLCESVLSIEKVLALLREKNKNRSYKKTMYPLTYPSTPEFIILHGTDMQIGRSNATARTPYR